MPFSFVPYHAAALTGVQNPADVERFNAHLPNARLVLAGATPLAAVTHWKNAVHPQLMPVAVLLAETCPTETFPALIEAIVANWLAIAKAQHFAGISLTTQSDATALASELNMRGMRRVRTTYLPEVPLSAVTAGKTAVRTGAASKPTTSPAVASRVLTLRELLATQPLATSFKKTVQAAYAAVHQLNPVREMTPDEWWHLIEADLLQELPTALVDETGQVRAFALSYRASAQVAECGYVFGEEDALLPLWQKVVEALQARGFTTLTGEFDDTDPCALAVLSTLPQVGLAELATFVIKF
ncbi:hypothetical protein [Lacticaseibacillus mingshuiensis]|uniref:GNAT family N-acetyltransferase n=1 Tax=Lacticaseibacillus mingshuiensis TaxID=2799574 RepID=A0ABW4CI14_9LACO|nr:hypothetical protein [Lacticaseibacillus mingshuiensis]